MAAVGDAAHAGAVALGPDELDRLVDGGGWWLEVGGWWLVVGRVGGWWQAYTSTGCSPTRKFKIKNSKKSLKQACKCG